MAGNAIGQAILNIMDMAFSQAAEAFLRTHEPSTHTAHLRADLQWFVTAFGATSQGLSMQRWLLMLHNYYNLEGLVDDRVLGVVILNATAYPHSLLPATHPNDDQAPHLPPDRSSNPPLEVPPTQLPSAGNVGEMSGSVIVSTEAGAERREATEGFGQIQHPHETNVTAGRRPNRIPPAHDVSRQAGNVHVSNLPPLPKHHYPHNPNRCHPPNLERKFSITDRDKDWMYKCDECGHAFRYRSEFRRHFHGQAGVREGFKVVGVMPDVARVWYGEDNAGNEYMGHMLFHPKAEGHRAHYAPVPNPCASRARG